MHVLASHTFLEDLALVLCVAAITTIIFQKIRQPVVVGYLIAGMIVGPNLPIPLLADSERIHTLSELGVILLMFALGLEFSVRKLIRLGPTSGFITALQVGFMIWLGYVCGRALGWTPLESIFTGAILSISSTTIVAKAYQETPVSERLRELVFGVLLAEDLTAVVELAILTTLASGASVSASLMTVTIARLILFLVAFVGIGFLIVPPFVRLVVRMGRPETTLVTVVGICFAFAILAEHAGYSVALGAFLAGSLVAESGEAGQIEHLVAPLRDIFGAVFFVSVGMMIDPSLIQQHWQALIVLTVAVIGGKIIGVTFASVLSGVGTKTSIEAGMSLSQIGEFSFIIAGAGLKSGATRDFLYTLAVAVSAVTTFLTPYMIRSSIPVAEFISARLPRPLKVLEAVYDSWFERIRNAGQTAKADNSIVWPTARNRRERSPDRRDSNCQRTRSARPDVDGRQHRTSLLFFRGSLCGPVCSAAMHRTRGRDVFRVAPPRHRARLARVRRSPRAWRPCDEGADRTASDHDPAGRRRAAARDRSAVYGAGRRYRSHSNLDRIADRRRDSKRPPNPGADSQRHAADRRRSSRRSDRRWERLTRSSRHRQYHAR